MTAAAAARSWWAARRSRRDVSERAATRTNRVAFVSSCALLILTGTTIACAIAGLSLTRDAIGRIRTEQHAALRVALDELHAASGSADRFDSAQLQSIERRSGLKSLRLELDPIVKSDRELQSLHDAQGRIVGWLSWAPGHTRFDAMTRLWWLIGAVGAAFAFAALFSLFALRRLARSLGRARETVRRLTDADPLTGLPNHRTMLRQLDDALQRRQSKVIVLMLIDLDSFREVNDTLGRAGGDTVLAELAMRLRRGLPVGTLFGRFEDDEFAVITSADDDGAASGLADTLRGLIARPIVKEQIWHISAGIGVAQAPLDGATGDELSRRASLALRAAKREGRGMVRRFDPQFETEDSERRFLRRELETAITAKMLDVHYQPVVAAAGGGMVGVEALARWTHPTRGAIAPSTFIPLAERSGLMLQLGEVVLRRALAEAARWPTLEVAVNLSPLQIRDRALVDLVGTVMAEAGIEPSRVVLEVTESVLIAEPEEALIRLEALRALGVSIALDDFGTGYSSLSYLQKFPFSRLKIDRAFTASLGVSGHAGAIIQSIVTLGHALGLKVVAEGVETDEQRVLLRLAGCDEMQGFLFAKPCPAELIDTALERSVAKRTIRRKVPNDAR